MGFHFSFPFGVEGLKTFMQLRGLHPSRLMLAPAGLRITVTDPSVLEEMSG
jgi:hypothetical protein